MKISVGISNRHIHLTKEDMEILFGTYKLHEIKKINQPNQFAALETVTIKTDKSQIESVRILGPIRDYTQVEISRTDAYKLGIDPPIRDSGDIDGSSIITIIGPVGEITKPCCIIANRHIHITPKQKKLYGLEGLEEVHIKVDGEKGCILNHVYLKEDEQSYFELHLDTDDANACGLKNGNIVTILEGNNDIQNL